MSDLYVNQIGKVLVVAPSPSGQLKHLVEKRSVAFYGDSDPVPAITRWIFADIPTGTLNDLWGNSYDHQVHSLLSGSIEDGKRFLELLAESGFFADEQSELFVPFQKIDINSQDSSDSLRVSHPRAFALARRASKTISNLVTELRGSALV